MILMDFKTPPHKQHPCSGGHTFLGTLKLELLWWRLRNIQQDLKGLADLARTSMPKWVLEHILGSILSNLTPFVYK